MAGAEIIEDARPIGVGLPVTRIAAVVSGNALEFYAFLSYSFFAEQIGNTFFPKGMGYSAVFLSELIFFAGFLTRPFGAFVIGTIGDRYGRKPAMVLSFSLMGAAIVGLALTPSYRAIGIAAPIIAVLFRMLQGFALGGEVGPTTAYLLEAAPVRHRGFYTSIQYGTQDFSILVAGIVGFVLAKIMSPQGLEDWGWRIAFLLGAVVVPFGLMIRRNLPETMPAGESSGLSAAALVPHTRAIVLGFILLACMTITYYVIAYLTTYAQSTLHMPADVAFGATIVAGLAGTLFDVTGGALSDRVGRKPVLLVAGALVIASILPAFFVMSHYRTATALLGATAVMSVFVSFFAPPILIGLTEALPRSVRAGGLAIVYALAISLVGGATQPVVTRLIEITGDPLVPAWVLLVTLSIGFTAALFTRETAPVKTGIVTP